MKSGKDKKREIYKGFEQGPIRPPSEANSLLIRVTRNCPWNQCTFCPVYKRRKFSSRPVDHVIKDIDMVHAYVEKLREKSDGSILTQAAVRKVSDEVPGDEAEAFYAAIHWFSGGLESIFIQDANSLIIPPYDLIRILRHLRKKFPWTQRITSYARSKTIAKIEDNDLKAMREAGLNRIHIGLESGSDKVLKMVKKGATKKIHIKAGQKVKKAGMELSEYVMPGLGGVDLSKEHALETADALNQINADFIRLRTLAIPERAPLFKEYETGNFKKCTDIMMAREILLFIENLDGITSRIKSDHILNLFQEIDGKLPGDKENMVSILKRFVDMEPERQCIYQVGRRLGIMNRLSDMESPHRVRKVETFCAENHITPENADMVVDELMKRFV